MPPGDGHAGRDRRGGAGRDCDGLDRVDDDRDGLDRVDNETDEPDDDDDSAGTTPGALQARRAFQHLPIFVPHLTPTSRQ